MKISLMLFLIGILGIKSQEATAQCTINDITVPDTFKVSGNNITTFQVQARNTKEIKFLVYSRMGKKIFESSSSIMNANATEFKRFDTGWEGGFMGKRLLAGRYVYMLEAICLDQHTIHKSGTLILNN